MIFSKLRNLSSRANPTHTNRETSRHLNLNKKQVLAIRLAIFAITGLLLVWAWPSFVAGMPLSAEQQFNRTWETTREVGQYRFVVNALQTIYPTVRAENVGRSPQQDILSADGMMNLHEEQMELNLSSAGNQPLQMRVIDGIAYGRTDGNEEWARIEDPGVIFAPGNDLMGFATAAVNIEMVTHWDEELAQDPLLEIALAEATVLYEFDVDGLKFAQFMRDQAEQELVRNAELMPGQHLQVADQYVDMTGRGQLWVNRDGLPIYQLLTIEFPPDRLNMEWVEATIATQFLAWEHSDLAQSGFGPLARIWQDPSILSTDPISLLPNTQLLNAGNLQPLGFNIGVAFLILAMFTAAYMVFLYVRPRAIYQTLSVTVVFTMIAGPLLQVGQAHAYSDRLTDRLTRNDQDQAETADFAAEEPAFDPSVNPLAGIDNAVLESETTEVEAIAQADLAAASTCDTSIDDGDCDGDGLTNAAELYRLGTDPEDIDTDGDLISDRVEVEGFNNGNQWYLNPLDGDTNQDGIVDFNECDNLVDIDIETGTFSGVDVSGQVCEDTDGDGTPDVFDFDNDGDRVPDMSDGAPSFVNDIATSNQSVLDYNISGYTVDKAVAVEFHIQPANLDHLWRANQTINWPEDRYGQFQMVHDRQVTAAPMLEITIPAPSTNSSNKIGSLPTTEVIGSIGNNDGLETWLDTDMIEKYGLNIIQSSEGGEIKAYLPVGDVVDELTGAPVAWSARMIYRPEVASWGADHEMRLVWFISGTMDRCETSDMPDEVTIERNGETITITDDTERYNAWCEDIANWDPDPEPSILHTYNQDFRVTNMNVTEFVDVQTAAVAQNDALTASSEDDLWRLANGLGSSYLQGRLYDDGGNLTRFDLAEIKNRFDNGSADPYTNGADELWGIDNGQLHIDLDTTSAEDRADGISQLALIQVPQILSDTFQTNGSPLVANDIVTIMTLREEKTRFASFNNETMSVSNGLISIDMSTQQHTTRGTAKFSPYEYNGIDWEPVEISSYIHDELVNKLDADLLDSDVLDLLEAGQSIDDMAAVRSGLITLSISTYIALYQGVSGMSEFNGETVVDSASSDPNDYLVDDSNANSGSSSKSWVNMSADTAELYAEAYAEDYTRNGQDGDLNTSLAGKLDFLDFVVAAVEDPAILNPFTSVESIEDTGELMKQMSTQFRKKVLKIEAEKFSWQKKAKNGVKASAALSAATRKFGPELGLTAANTTLLAVSIETSGEFVAAVETYGAIKKSKEFKNIGWYDNLVDAQKVSKAGAALDFAIEGAVIIGVFIYEVVDGGIRPGSIAFNTKLAEAIGQLVIALISAVVSAIFPIGTIIIGVLDLIDILMAATCAIINSVAGAGTTSAATDKWVCGGISGALAAGLTEIIYDTYLTVKLDAADRVQMAMLDPVIDADSGFVQGVTVQMGVEVTTTLTLGKIEDGLIDRSFTTSQLKDRMRRSTFAYNLQFNKQPHHNSLSFGQVPWGGDSQHVFQDTIDIVYNNPGLNRSRNFYLTESYNVVTLECWGFIWTSSASCDEESVKASHHTKMKSIVIDILPATIDGFLNTQSKNRLRWLSSTEWQEDIDGDGMPSWYESNYSIGPDFDGDGLPDGYEHYSSSDWDSWDSDSDGLSDYWERFYGTNPHWRDTDGDGINDGLEFPHSQARSPFEDDTQAWTGGWTTTYDYDNNGDPLQTWVWPDPLAYDPDGDTLKDSKEKLYGYNPNVSSAAFPFSMITEMETVSIQAGVVSAGEAVSYTATIENLDQSNSMVGTVDVELPTGVIRDTQSWGPILLDESTVVNGLSTPGAVGETTQTELLIRAEGSFGAYAETATSNALIYLPLDEADTTGTLANLGSHGANGTCTVTTDPNVVGCPLSGDGGKLVRGLSFADAKSQIDVPYTSDLNDDQFTMALWVRPFTQDNNRFLIGRESNISLGQDNTVKVTVVGGASCETSTTVETTYQTGVGRIRHIAATYDGSTIRVYRHGIEIGSAAHTAGVCDTSTPFMIGDGSDNGFIGQMDEVLYLNTALSATEVSNLSQSQEYAFHVEATHPVVIDATGPEAYINLGTDVANQSVILDMIVEDDYSVISMVAMTITSPSTAVFTPAVTESDDSNNQWLFNFTPDVEGEYSVEIAAWDAVSNKGLSQDTIYVDHSPPEGITDSALTDNLLTTAPDNFQDDNSLTLSGVITDNRRLVSTMTVDIEDWLGTSVDVPQSAAIDLAEDELTGSWQVDYTFPGAAYGTYDVVGSMEDFVGNEISTTIGVLNIDDYGPVSDITIRATTISRTHSISGTISDVRYTTGGRLAHFHFDEAAGATSFLDGTQTKYEAKCSGGSCPTAGASAQYGTAVQFDGNDLLSITSKNAALAVNQDVVSPTFAISRTTLAAWIYPTWGSGSNGYNPTVLAVDDGSAFNFRWQIADDYSGMLLTTPSGTESVAAAIAPNQWTHIALTMENGQWQGHINGIPTGAVTQTVGTTYDLPVNIGGSNSSNGFFTGSLDEVVIYDSALTLDQVYDIANVLPTTVSSLQVQARHMNGAIWPDVDPDGLLLYLALDDENGSNTFFNSSVITESVACDSDSDACPAGGYDGAFGTAMRFDGDDYIEIPGSEDWHFGQMAISFWIKEDGIFNGQTIISKGDTAWELLLSPEIDEGKIYFSTLGVREADNNSVWYLSSNTRVDSGTWRHVVVMYDGETKKIYTDGVLRSSQEVTGSLIETNDPIRIGGLGDSLFDEFAIFNRALTEDEIQSLYTYDTWQEATLSNTNTSYANWEADLPELEGLYTIGLRATDSMGNERFNPEAWTGPIDLKAPRILFEYVSLPDDNVQVYCYAEDLNIVSDGWVCPSGAPTAETRQNSDWYVDYFSPVTRTVGLGSAVTTINTTSDGTMTACDDLGNCTTETKGTTSSDEGNVILSPITGSQLDNFEPVTIRGYSWSNHRIRQVNVYVNGDYVGNEIWSYSNGPTETEWEITWFPPQGVSSFEITAIAITGEHNNTGVFNEGAVGLLYTQSDTIIEAPSLRIEKSVSSSLVATNEIITYTIVIANNGLRPLSNVVVSHTLPSGVSPITSIGDINELIDLNVGEAVTYTIPVIVTAGQNSVITSTATIDHTGHSGGDDSVINVCQETATVTTDSFYGPGSINEALTTICDGATINFSGDTYIYNTDQTFYINQSVVIDGGEHEVIIDAAELMGQLFHFESPAETVVIRNIILKRPVTAVMYEVGPMVAIIVDDGIDVTFDGVYYIGGNLSSRGSIENSGDLTIVNSTFNGNAQMEGGENLSSSFAADTGIAIENRNGGTLELRNSSVNNHTIENDSGGLIVVDYSTHMGDIDNEGTVRMNGSLIANGDCSGNGTFEDLGYNLFSDTTSCPVDSGTAVTVTAAVLASSVVSGTLMDNGGQTKTYALLANSLAQDVIPANSNDCDSGAILADQRGVARPQNGSCDIGSFEIYYNTAAGVVDDIFSMNEDSVATFDVLANDTDVDGNSMTLDSVTQPGSGTVAIVGNQIQVTPDADMYGQLTFTYIVSDGLELSTAANVTVNVTDTNDSPLVSASADLEIRLPVTATLTGSVFDDGLPTTPGAVTTVWTKVSGPGTVTFADDTAVATSADFSAAGSYVLQLTASDGVLSDFAQVTISVLAANTAPVVDAGSDISITLPISTTMLDGTVTDDGVPNGTLTYQWTQLSGFGQAVFGDETAVDTAVSFSADGDYVLQLTASDGALSTSDTVTVTVAPEVVGDNTGEEVAPPVVTISFSNQNDLLVSWTGNENGCNYQMHRSTDPYFSASETTELSSLLNDTDDEYTDAGTVTDETNYYYQVAAVGCEQALYVSNEVGVFHFGLEPGGN